MVVQKDSRTSDTSSDLMTEGLGDSKDNVNLRPNRKFAILGGVTLSILSVFGVKEILQSPEEKIAEAITEVMEEGAQNPEPSVAPPSSRVVVNVPSATPPSSVGRPESPSTSSTVPELSAEELFINEYAGRFSEILDAYPVSAYDVALKASDFPNPVINPQSLIEADMASMSLILTHSQGEESIINALFNNTPGNPYPNIDSLFDDAMNIGDFRFPPENHPEFTEDRPYFGVMYRPIFSDSLSAFTIDGGNTFIIETFGIERVHFNYDEVLEGWYLTRQEIYASSVSRTYTKQVVPLQNDAGEVVMTEVWQLTSLSG